MCKCFFDKISTYVNISNKARSLIFGLSLHLHPKLVCVSSTVKTLVSMCICADSSEPPMLADVLSTKISCTCPNNTTWLDYRILHAIGKKHNPAASKSNKEQQIWKFDKEILIGSQFQTVVHSLDESGIQVALF